MFPVFHFFQVRVSDTDVEAGWVFSLVITSWLYCGESERNSQSSSVYSSRCCTGLAVSVLFLPKMHGFSPLPFSCTKTVGLDSNPSALPHTPIYFTCLWMLGVGGRWRCLMFSAYTAI